MAVRRELVYDERGGFAAADKLTPEKKQLNQKQEMNAARRAVAANPLGDPPVPLAACCSSSCALCGELFFLFIA